MASEADQQAFERSVRKLKTDNKPEGKNISLIVNISELSHISLTLLTHTTIENILPM